MNRKIGITVLRCVLAALIVLNMTVIFLFSAQDGKKSGETSGRVSQTVAEITVKDFDEKPKAEQNQIVQGLQLPVRKIAHMLEFGSLGMLTFLLLLTFSLHPFSHYAVSLVFVFLYACTDEWHQSLTSGRGARFTDVLIDLSGALICCTLLLGIYFLVRACKKLPLLPLQITTYQIAAKLPSPKRLAIASDLHGANPTRVLQALTQQKPDLILIPGDLGDDKDLRESNAPYQFLTECAKIAPTYYSLGNHEIACYHKGNPWRHPIPIPLTDEVRERINKTGATLLEDRAVRHGDLMLCGLTSGINGKRNAPDPDILAAFEKERGYRILLCHHPEYFVPHVQKTSIELTVCGHAHGGQWRWFGIGTYAPGQGILPKYTAGVLQNRCVISRGLGNHTWIPRIYNTPELVLVELTPCNQPENP